LGKENMTPENKRAREAYRTVARCEVCRWPLSAQNCLHCRKPDKPDRFADAGKTIPYGWMVEGSHQVFFGEHAEKNARREAMRIGGTCKAFPIYLDAA
jgi:hypothetical protein